MYKDLQNFFWWHGMKRDIATFIACCDSCQRIKAEHQKPAGLLQPNKIPEWKWDEIGMDFIVGLPRSRHGNNAIWVITDRLTKVAHFIPVKTTHTTQRLARLYLWTATVTTRKRCHMGHNRQINQCGTFYSSKNNLHHSETSPTLSCPYRLPAWSP